VQFLCLVRIRIDRALLRSMENKSNGRFDEAFDGWKAKRDCCVILLMFLEEVIADAIERYMRL
jgi:hypothetical protein